MPPSKQTLGRYQIRGGIGRGSMGVVDRGYDPVLKQEVAIKTLYGAQDLNILELFKRECSILSGIGGHPNVMEILDIGETDGPSGRRPYFVMPLLTGVTLEEWMQSASSPNAVEQREQTPEQNEQTLEQGEQRIAQNVQALVQIARGLQAAHDQGLLHRDLKPSNIFVQEDGSIKIMDFGVACLTGQRTLAGAKRTQLYTSPEQLLGKPPTAAADQFSLGIISYELLAGKHPFSLGGTSGGDESPSERIVAYQPPLCSVVNPAVSELLSRVVDKALAKDPSQRFATVREYGECLQKALRKEPIEIFDAPKVDPRVLQAQQAFSDGDITAAGSLIRELKSETILNTQVRALDRELAGVLQDHDLQKLVQAAVGKFAQKEYSAALDQVEEVLATAPSHAEALSLKTQIEAAIAAGKAEAMLRAATHHCYQREHAQAREIADKLRLQTPDDSRVNLLVQEIERESRKEIELENRRREEAKRAETAKQAELAKQAEEAGKQAEVAKQAEVDKQAERAKRDAEVHTVYEVAMARFRRGDTETTLTGLESFLAKQPVQTNDTAERLDAYRKLLADLKSKRDRLQEQEVSAKRNLSEENFPAARTICQEVLREYPENSTFIGLLDQCDAGEEQQAAAAGGQGSAPEVAKPVPEAPKQVEDITRERPPLEAPHEQTAAAEVELSPRARSRQSFIESMALRARQLEEERKVGEAFAQWETLKAVYPDYPGIDAALGRLGQQLSEQSRAAAKTGWLARISQAMSARDYGHANSLLKDALAAFPGDAELAALAASIDGSMDERSRDSASRDSEVAQLLAQAKGLHDQGNSDAALNLLRKAPNQDALSKGLADLLLKRAEALAESDWFGAETLLSEATALDPQNPLLQKLKQRISDKKLARRAAAPVTGPAEKPSTRPSADAKPNPVEPKAAAESSLDDAFERTRMFQPTVEEDGTVRLDKPVVPAPPTTTKSAEPAKAAQPAKELPKPEKIAPAAKTPVDQKRLMTFGLIGGLAAILLVLVGLSYFRKPAEEKPAAQAPVPVSIAAVTGVTGATYRIEDSTAKDVTAQATGSGLIPGNYRLAASRPGFAPIDAAFTVDRAEKSHAVDAAWTLLPVQLVVRSPQPATLSIDEMPVAASDSGDFEKAVASGNHHIAWTSGKLTSEFDLAVNEGGVTQSNWTSKVAGFAAVTELGRIAYDSKNLPVQVDGAKSQATGTLMLPAAGQAIHVQAGPSSLELARVDDSRFFASILVLLAQPAASPKPAPKAAVRPPAKTVTPEPVKPAAPVKPEPPPVIADPPQAKESALDRLKKRAGQPDK